MNRKAEEDALARRNRELSILNSIAQALHREIDLDRALDVVLAQVTELFDLHTGWVFLVHEETGETYLAAAHNLPPGLAENPALLTGRCYCLDTYFAGDLAGAANVNIITCSRLKKLVTGSNGLRFHATIPLYAQEQKLGVLNVASTNWHELSQDDLRLLYTVGDLLSIAVERARLFVRSAQIGAVEERNRLARELHDTLAQGLSAIALQLETADALLDAGADGQKARRYLQKALTLTQRSLEDARRSVLDLRAAPLEGNTLWEALRVLAAGCTERSQRAVAFHMMGDQRPLPLHVEVGLYRIAQEALNNALRHADAQHIELALTLQPDRALLEVEDDGRGFDVEDAPPERFGLVGMNERARLLGGALEIHSDPGMGTRIAVTVPLTE